MTTAARPAWAAIRTGAIAGWSVGAVLAVVTHSPMFSSIGAGVLAGIASGATYVLLARVLGHRAAR